MCRGMSGQGYPGMNTKPTGSIAQIQSALEAAGIRGQAADDVVDGARCDHDMFGAETEGTAADRARGYVKELTDTGVMLGADAALSIQGELTRYFMTPREEFRHPPGMGCSAD